MASGGYLNADTRASVAVALLALALLLDLTGVAAGSFQYRLLSRQALDEVISEAEATTNDAVYGCVGLFQVVVFLACAVAFLMWFRRSYENLLGLGVLKLQYSPGWAVGGFFVPLLNLVRPYQIATEIWRGSTPYTTPSDTSHSRFGTRVVTLWWLLFLFSGFTGNFAARMMLNNGGSADLRLGTTMAVVSDLLSLGAAILAIVVIRSIRKMQETKHRQLALDVGASG